MSSVPAQEPKARLWNANYTKAWVGNFLLFFSVMIMTPLFPVYLSQEFAADKDTIGLVLAGFSVSAIVARLLSGYMVDSFPRLTVLLTGYVLFFLFMGGYLLAGSLLAFAVLRTLHGLPFGITTVANSTVAVDSLVFSRRAEGIGYYGLSNNVATALAPSLGLAMFGAWANFDYLLWAGFLLAGAGALLTGTTRLPRRPRPLPRKPFRIRGLIFWRGWSSGTAVVCFSFAYGIVSTYIALYGMEMLGITQGTGMFFMLFSVGLILSRLVGGRTLKKGKIVQNGIIGCVLGSCGYLLFAALHNEWGFYGAALICGLGNGHMFPAVQNMYIGMCTKNERGTANSTLLVSWDVGFGIGTLLGGIVADAYGYYAAFWTAALVNLAGAIFFILHSGADFRRHRINS